MLADCSLPQVPEEVGRAQTGIRIPTSTISNAGIQLTLTRSSSKQMTSTAASNQNMIFSSHPDQSTQFIEPRPLSSIPSLTSIQNTQKIVVTSNQQRQGVTYVRLNRTVGQLPPVQRITVRNPNQPQEESPERIISHRFTVKSVDRDSNRQLCSSQERHKAQPVKTINFDDLIKEQIQIITTVFNQKVAQEQAFSNSELRRLEQRLRIVEGDLNAKNGELTKLKAAYEQALKDQAYQSRVVMNKAVAEATKQERLGHSHANSLNKQEMDKNFEYITGRMRDLDTKIRLVVQNQQSSSESSQLNIKTSRYFMQQLDQFRKDFIQGSQKELGKLKETLLQSVTNKETKLISLQQQLAKIASAHTSNQQSIASVNQKVKLADQLKQLKWIAQKMTKMTDEATLKIDMSKLTPLQQDLVGLKTKLRQLENKNNIELRNLSQQINDCHSSMVALTSKTASENTKLQQLQSINQKQTFKVKDFQTKNLQLQQKNQTLIKNILEVQAKEQQTKACLKKTSLSLEQSLRKNLELECKFTEMQGLLARTSLNFDGYKKKVLQLQQKNQQYEATIKKSKQSLDESLRQNDQILRKTKSQQSKQFQKQVKTLKANTDNLERSNSELNQQVSELSKNLQQRCNKIKQLELLNNIILEQKKVLETLNKDLQNAITRLTIRATEPNHNRYNEGQMMTKTQSIKFNDQLQSNIYSSKASTQSEQQLLSLKKTRSNKIESSDEDNSTLHRHTSNKILQSQKHLTQSKIRKQDLPEKLSKLKQIFKLNRKPLPLSCEIDQTGYLKDCEEGTYIYDNQGNLFVLSKEELSRAIRSRIISI